MDGDIFIFLPQNFLLQHVCLSDVRFIIHNELNACVIGLDGHLILTVSVAIPILDNCFPSIDIQLLVLLCHHETLLLQLFLGSGLVVSCNVLQLLLSSLPLCLNLLSWTNVSPVVFFLVSVVAVIFHFIRCSSLYLKAD